MSKKNKRNRKKLKHCDKKKHQNFDGDYFILICKTYLDIDSLAYRYPCGKNCIKKKEKCKYFD